jgi:uncharacterized protein (TIGR00297 family)
MIPGSILLSLAIGLLLGCCAAGAAWVFKALSTGGAIAAALLGTVVFGLGGLPWAIVLLTFFFTSSLLSFCFKGRKVIISEKYAKGERRDAGQVLANGGIAGICVILHVCFPNSILPWLGFTASLAAANADTWATELGILSPNEPLLIFSNRRVARGTSGGVSLAGTLASFTGALTVCMAAGILSGLPIIQVFLLALCGLAGSLIDSTLGATIQAIYYCPACQKETEKHPRHSCGTETRQIRGWGWLNNDWVNVACTLGGAALGMLSALWIG